MATSLETVQLPSSSAAICFMHCSVISQQMDVGACMNGLHKRYDCQPCSELLECSYMHGEQAHIELKLPAQCSISEHGMLEFHTS